MKPIFKTHLQFRDRGSFGQCDVCHRLRAKIRKPENKAQKQSAVQAYTKHLLAQWLDRQCYWTQRALSRQWFSQAWQFGRKLQDSQLASSFLTVIQDGMDQSKLRVPRQGYQAMSKSMSLLYRPALHLIGTFCHGFKLRIHVTDEDLKKDSETCIECIALALCEILQVHGRLPLCFHLQQDNCAREGKNPYMLGFALLLVALKIVRVSALGFCRTCHSHEDIDQCFGQIARLLMGRVIGSADEMVSIIGDAMAGGGKDEGRLRGSQAEASKLDQVSCWKPFTAQTGVVLKGLRRVHYFSFCCRRDLGSDVLDHVLQLEELGARWPVHPDDVFLVSKRWLADQEVARAIMVLPSSLAESLRQGYQPPGIAVRKVIPENMRKNLAKHVPRLRRSGEMSASAADYLLSWSTGTLKRRPKPELYPVFAHRFCPTPAEVHVPGAFKPPGRKTHFDMTLEAEGLGADLSDEGSDSDNGGLELPNGFDF